MLTCRDPFLYGKLSFYASLQSKMCSVAKSGVNHPYSAVIEKNHQHWLLLPNINFFFFYLTVKCFWVQFCEGLGGAFQSHWGKSHI